MIAAKEAPALVIVREPFNMSLAIGRGVPAP